MLDELHNFYFQSNEPNKSCLLTLRDTILNHNKNISESRKYGMPCFCYYIKALCYLWVDKKLEKPYILLVDGRKIEHPELITGNRKRMKVLIVDPLKDIQIQTIKLILDQAIKLVKK